MLNIISFLLIVLASVICLKSADIPNHLLNLGVLILSGYSLSTLARYLKLPAVTGYVIAGIMLSPDGLGFINAEITADMTIIESILFMLLIAEAVSGIVQGKSLRKSLFTLGAGVLCSSISLTIIFGLLMIAGLPLRTSILFSLFAATFAPVMYYATARDNTYSPLNMSFVIGAFGIIFLFWCISAAIFDPESIHRVQTALAPVFIAATSLVAGIVWGLITEFAFFRTGQNPHSLFPVTALFLVYPLTRLFGFDSIFIGAGFGIYFGIFSNRKELIGKNGLSAVGAIIIFTLFGARLSLEDVFILGVDGWWTVSILLAALFIGRLIGHILTKRVLHNINICPPAFTLSILSGPLTLLMVHRFGPALSSTTQMAQGIPHNLTVITSTMLLIATLIPAFQVIQRFLPLKRNVDIIDN